MEGEGQRRLNPQLERFVRAFEKSTAAQESLATAFEGLARLIAHDKDGLIRTMDDLGDDMKALREEIRGLRKDLRSFARARGFGGLLEMLGG